MEEQDTPPIEVRTTARRSAPLPMLPELEFTGPVEHIQRDWNDAERDAFNELKRDPTSAATIGHLIRLRIAWVQHAGAQDSAIRALYDRQIETEDLDDRTRDVEKWQKKADKAVDRAQKLFWSALAMFLLSIGGGIALVWNRSAQETEARLKLEQTREEAADLKRRFEQSSEQQRLEIEKLRELLYRRPSSQFFPSKRADDPALDQTAMSSAAPKG